ncbi:MAG: sugar transferase [Rhodomicrobium sp.]|nr:sugar transferase [Rhodomicrobium sp.]
MRRFGLLFADIALLLFATFSALVLRDNFEVSAARLSQSLTYFLATGIMALIVCPPTSLYRTVWRFGGVADYLRVAGATAAVAAGAVAITFAYNRMDGVARSLPVLQWLAGTVLLIGVRVLHQLHHAARQQRKAAGALLQPGSGTPAQTVLIVGVTRLAETYLQAIAEFVPGQIKVAGFIGQSERYVGRLIATYPVLGVPEQIEDILDRLDVHGISADRIVVACAFQGLSPEAQEALRHVERCRNIPLQDLAENLGLHCDSDEYPARGQERTHSQPSPAELHFEIEPYELKLLAQRPYWKLKRAADCIAALSLLTISSPVMLIVWALVMVSHGSPSVFWQQRPGLGGRPFRLYKFRTMRAAYAPDGRRLLDSERTSCIGSILRRLRLDELPQLLNILRGEMSFVGPRPLLPKDQSEAYRARLLVRPGLTGWAQVVGGRNIPPEDKAALDVWYVRHASLALDFEIAARTIPVVLFGERISFSLIEHAWRDLSESGVLKGELTSRIKNSLYVTPSRV